MRIRPYESACAVEGPLHSQPTPNRLREISPYRWRVAPLFNKRIKRDMKVPHLSRFLRKVGDDAAGTATLLCRRMGPRQNSLWDTTLKPDHLWQRRFYDFVVWSQRKRVKNVP